jgi:enterochelin esterase-like enzyme
VDFPVRASVSGQVGLILRAPLRSSIWKLGVGTFIGGLLALGSGYSLQTGLADGLRHGNTRYWAEAELRSSAEDLPPANLEELARAAIPPSSDDWPIRAVETSPAIVALKQRLESGDLLALEEFWRDAAKNGTPLIEPAKSASNEVIVTFIWRGDPSTQGVALLAPLQKSPGMGNFPLSRLLSSDVWYKCWQMRDDLRFTYRLQQNGKPGEKDASQQPTIDPLNPHRINVSYDEGAPTTESSIASMPHALDESWILSQPGVPVGKLEQHQLKSAILGKERGISVYTPPGYSGDAKVKYWLLVLFDGFFYRSSIPASTILDNLIHARKLPPMVAVLIDNPRESRISELGYNPAFAEFLSKEVLPWIHERWNVTHDPKKCIVGGLSMGGSAAAYVAMRHPEIFGNVLSQSGAFADGKGADVKWEWLASQYKATPKLPLRFFIEEGLMEDISRDGPTGLTANRQFVELLKSKGYWVVYEEVGGSHEPVHWRDTLPQGLIALMESPPEN